MIVSLIVAVSQNGVIGNQGGIPWRLSTDMKMFKQLTMGHILIMGRKTFESIGKPLPGRKMIVITRQEEFEAEGCDVVHSLNEALEIAGQGGETEAFIAGGAEVYANALPIADRIYFTRVLAEVQGDTYFPPFDESDWRVVREESIQAGAKNEFDFIFRVLEKINE